MTPDGEGIQKFEEIVLRSAGELTTEDGTIFTRTPLHRLPRDKDVEPRILEVATLESFRDYILAGVEDESYLGNDQVILHVVSPTRVEIISSLFGDSNQRFTYLAAITKPLWVPKEEFVSLEEMNIALKARFTDAGDRDQLILFLGNVVEAKAVTATDDGFSQDVEARRGIAGKDIARVPNPVKLAPWRTFPELDQPLSEFVVRLSGGGENSLPKVGLFLADGGRWELEAKKAIKEWLQNGLREEGYKVIA